LGASDRLAQKPSVLVERCTYKELGYTHNMTPRFAIEIGYNNVRFHLWQGVLSGHLVKAVVSRLQISCLDWSAEIPLVDISQELLFP
jgi:hypothetical protein